MDKELINEILEYVETSVEESDARYGMRSFDQLLKEKDVPDFYFKLKSLLDDE